ncbi:MAG: serine/threonine-protein phosphatase [Acetobacteraceae bacterium]|nr:serine/threonine-protein phosphatase [Acetobacteraceae bacterium]
MSELECRFAAAGRFRSWAATHPGAVRAVNQDRYVNRPDLGIWAVADGAGGHAEGQYAATLLAQALETLPPALAGAELLTEVRGRILAAHQALHEESARHGHEIIASTIVVLLARDDHYACLWAGDSRAYLMRAGILNQITRDHSLVEELVDAGVITAEEREGHPQANIITRAVGATGELELDKVSDRLVTGDRFLLCSDGLSKVLASGRLVEILTQDEPAEWLLSLALSQQPDDNVTAVVVVLS